MTKKTLIVAEKPISAERIAQALDKKGRPQKVEEKGVPYFLAERDGGIIVVSALGHLYTVTQSEKSKAILPSFDFTWTPRYRVEKNAQATRVWLEIISKLALEAEDFINACDYDVEGSLIGYNILNYTCGKASSAKRMKYSTLTKTELQHAYENLSPTLDFNVIEAGKTRHEVDWLYGINLSRALTSAAKRSGGFALLSTGRVQGPTLNFLVQRENSIVCFVPTPYWTIKAQIEANGTILEADYEKKRIEKKSEADYVVKCCRQGRGEIARIDETKSRHEPPVPFDLGSLQAEAYRLFDYSPRMTSQLAESLYLDALISYPRTGSQKLPATIDCRFILIKLGKQLPYRRQVARILSLRKLRARQGKKDDPAHPAIHPTGNIPKNNLRSCERKLWDLIVRRFIASFSEAAERKTTKVEIRVDRHKFQLSRAETVKEGWIRVYKSHFQVRDASLSKLKVGTEVRVKQIYREDRFTKPRARYNPSSLLKKMEREGIGTKATRASVIQTLYNRNYITGKQIRVTELGRAILEILLRTAPAIISVELTRNLEDKMRRIQDMEEKREAVLKDAKRNLEAALGNLENKHETVSNTLKEAIFEIKPRKHVIGNCPYCGTGRLIIIRSRKTGKRFLGCSNFFKGICTTSSPIPQKGVLKPTGRLCKACNWPTLMVYRRRKRPWTLCPNPACTEKARRRNRVEMHNLWKRGRE
ncbi:MAG: DNA topoisomerase I [Candidatus Bathyarchaeota archaeon]|nr:MAG: DNA topoisomerase I [Candidatus Bathyarchaeota archaeon]